MQKKEDNQKPGKREEGDRGAGYCRLSFLLLVVTSAFQTGQVQLVNPLISGYAESLGIGVAFAGVIVGGFSAAALLARPASVLLCGRFPVKILACLSALAMGGASLLYPIAGGVWLLLTRIFHGAAYALCTTVLMAMAAALLPPEKEGRGMSLFGIGQVISVALAPAAGIWLNKQLGWGAAFWASAATAGLAALLVLPVKSPELQAEKTNWKGLFRREVLGKIATAAVITLTASLETAFILVYGEGLGAGNMGLYFTVSAGVMLAVRAFGGKGKLGFPQTMTLSLSVMAAAMVLLWSSRSASGGQALSLLLTASAVKSLGQGIAQPAVQAEFLRDGNGKSFAAGAYYFGCDLGQTVGPIAGGFTASAYGYPAVWLLAALLLVLNGAACFLSRGKGHRGSTS